MPWWPFANRLLTMGQKIKVEIQTGAIFAVAVALLMLSLSFLISFLAAAAVHELCHYLALRLAGVKMYRISIGPSGASMETEPMEPGREVLCAAAGPVGSFLLVAGYKFFPEMALCALIQGCFNLLPIHPLDGGRIVKGILELLKVPKGERIFVYIQLLTGGMVGVVCLYGFLRWNLGFGVLFLGAMMVLRALAIKTPCKEGLFGVQ